MALVTVWIQCRTSYEQATWYCLYNSKYWKCSLRRRAVKNWGPDLTHHLAPTQRVYWWLVVSVHIQVRFPNMSSSLCTMYILKVCKFWRKNEQILIHFRQFFFFGGGAAPCPPISTTLRRVAKHSVVSYLSMMLEYIYICSCWNLIYSLVVRVYRASFGVLLLWCVLLDFYAKNTLIISRVLVSAALLVDTSTVFISAFLKRTRNRSSCESQ